MRKILSLIAAILFAGSMMATQETIFTYNGKGVTDAESIVKAGGTLTVYGQNTNIVADQKQKGNMCIKINKGYSKDGIYYYMAITLDEPLQAGDQIQTAAFRTGSNSCVYGMDFNAVADSASASDACQVLFPDNLQILSSNGVPVDTTFTIPAEAAGARFIRLYRKSGSTGLWIANFTILRGEGGGDTPAEPTMAYYVAGSMTNWGPMAAYKLAPNPANEGEYMGEFTFAANDEFKVGYSDGTTIESTNYFPSGIDNNYVINEAGEYVVYFRPDGQGGEGWHYGFIYAAKKEAPADPTNCAEAAAAALSVENNNDLYNNGAVYTITGYVTGIKTAYNDNFHNISFWMADAADGGEVLQAYRAACASEADAPVVGDKVAVTGSLTKYNTTPEFAAGCTFEIIEHAAPGEDPVNLGPKTIAEFLELANMKDTCILTGIIDSVVNTQYGNFNLVDATGKVYVYGLLTAAGESKKCYEEENLAAGDTLTIKAIYNLYNNKPQVKNAIFVDVKHAESDVLEDGYYLVGDMNEWTPIADYMLYQNEEAEGEEYMIIMEFAANDKLKVRKVENGEATTWYPDNAENYTINEEGIYTVYFRPNADGGEGWYHGVIYTEKVQAVELNMTGGQLIVGEEEGYPYVQLDLFNFAQFDEEGRALGDGDWMTLYLFPEGETISGLYSVDEYTMMGEVYRVAGEDTLFVEALSGEASIEVLSIDVENETALIRVNAMLFCENNIIYNVIVERTVDYYEDGEEPTEAIENTKVAVDRNKIFKLIEAGKVVIEKNGVKYSINGQLMK